MKYKEGHIYRTYWNEDYWCIFEATNLGDASVSGLILDKNGSYYGQIGEEEFIHTFGSPSDDKTILANGYKTPLWKVLNG